MIDPVSDYLATLGEVFDFDLLRGFLKRPDFSMACVTLIVVVMSL